MAECCFYKPWSEVSPAKDTGPLPIAECVRYDDIGCKCLVPDLTCPRPWPVHVIQMKEEERWKP